MMVTSIRSLLFFVVGVGGNHKFVIYHGHPQSGPFIPARCFSRAREAKAWRAVIHHGWGYPLVSSHVAGKSFSYMEV